MRIPRWVARIEFALILAQIHAERRTLVALADEFLQRM